MSIDYYYTKKQISLFRWTRFDKRDTMLHTSIMTFAHVADLQLGCNRFDGRLSRRREQDFYDAWIDLAGRLAERRDIFHVLIVGDAFEHASPSTAARYAFERGLRLLQAWEKTVILISGNHDTPRAAETMHPLALYADWQGVEVVIDNPRSIDGFHCVPWAWNQPITKEDLFVDETCRVLAVHAPCPVLDEYRDSAREFLPSMGQGFQYVALGDYHRPQSVAPNAWYSGSTERTSFGEEDARVGGFIVTLMEEGASNYETEEINAKSRPMVTMHLMGPDVEEDIGTLLTNVTERPNTMWRAVIHGVEPTQVDPHLLAQVKDAGHFVKIVFQDRPAPPALVDFGPTTLYDQWHEFTEQAEYGPQVAEVGLEILEEAIAND